MFGAIKFTFTSIDINSNLLDLILRLVVAAACGFMIGFERKTRSKEAGIRTHAIVCMAAALMMVISKYGFADQTNGSDGIRGADSARIAAQIVSGIGFLGAGIIFYRRDMLHGLTTAAGVWATAAIGMAIGAGMYVIGAVSTALLIIMQVILHKPYKIFRTRTMTSLRLTVSMEDADVINKIQYLFDAKKFLKFKTISTESGIIADIELVTPRNFSELEVYEIVRHNPYIKTLEKTEEM